MRNEEIRILNEMRVLAMMANGPVSSVEVAKIAGMSRGVVWRHIQNLVADGKAKCVREARNLGRGHGLIPALYTATPEYAGAAKAELYRSGKALLSPVFRHPQDIAFFGPADRREGSIEGRVCINLKDDDREAA